MSAVARLPSVVDPHPITSDGMLLVDASGLLPGVGSALSVFITQQTGCKTRD